jgi:drug/metabolite transporter (DMT)-like permease
VTGSLLCAAAALLWGLWPYWLQGAPEPGGAAVALLVASAAGLPLALRQSRGRRRPPRAWLLLAATGVADAANVWLYFRALQVGAVAPAVLSHYLAPVLVALAAPALLGEPRSPRTAPALLLALAGTALLVSGARGGGAAFVPALLFGGASAIFYAALVLLSKRLGSSFGDAELLVYHMLLSAALLVAAGGVPPLLARPAIGGLVSTLVAGLLYYAGLRRVPAERAGMMGYLEPVSAITVGWVALGQAPPPIAAVGGALIVAAGLLVVTRPPSSATPGHPRRAANR